MGTVRAEERIRKIRERIIQASQRSGGGAVTLIAVTKTFPASAVKEALSAGITDIGESRIQEAQSKFLELGDAAQGITKHLIGHLQTNKAKKAVELFDLIQSVDSLYLAEEIDKQANKLGKTQECLLEVKVSGEDAKFGCAPQDAEAFLEQSRNLSHVRFRGVMTIAPYFDTPEQARPYFRAAREIFERLKANNCFSGEPVLSMGMSNDFEVAVEEGATMVRVGTAIFGER